MLQGEIGQKWDLVITFDWGGPIGPRLTRLNWTAFCKIFSEIPHLNIFGMLKYVPKYVLWGAYLIVLNMVEQGTINWRASCNPDFIQNYFLLKRMLLLLTLVHGFNPSLWSVHWPPFLPPCQSYAAIQVGLFQRKIQSTVAKADRSEPYSKVTNDAVAIGS